MSIDDITQDPIDPAVTARNNRQFELENEALRSVLNSRAGRRFIYRLMQRSGIDGMAFTGDNNITNFNFGRQSVAADLKADILAINGEAIILMMREAREDEKYVNGSTQSEPDDYNPNR